MHSEYKNLKYKKGGIIINILIAIAALVALKVYFHFDFIEWVKTPTGQKIMGPIWAFLKLVFTTVKGWVS